MHGSCHRPRTHRPRVERPSVASVGAGREPLVPADDLRASDAERERIVLHLRDQAGEGRLSVDELGERLDRAYAARTRRELVELTRDLPRPRRIAGAAAAVAARESFPDHLRTYLLVMALLVGIWAMTGADDPWPIWPAMGWGIGVLSHWSAARRAPSRPRLGTPSA